MECEACGRVNEGDARFCDGCAAPLPRRVPRRAAPEAGGLPPGRIVGLVVGLAVLGLSALRLANRPSVQIETIDIPAPEYRAPDAPLAPNVRAQAPARAPTESEALVAGTWVATVGFNAPRRAVSASSMVQLGAASQGQINSLQRCVWLELYPNLRGFSHECGVVNGEPSALEQTNPITGQRSSLGASFRWSLEGTRLRLEYDEDLRVDGVTLRTVEMELPVGSAPFDVVQTFPDHEEVAPQPARFEVFSGQYLDDLTGGGDGSGAPPVES